MSNVVSSKICQVVSTNSICRSLFNIEKTRFSRDETKARSTIWNTLPYDRGILILNVYIYTYSIYQNSTYNYYSSVTFIASFSTLALTTQAWNPYQCSAHPKDSPCCPSRRDCRRPPCSSTTCRTESGSPLAPEAPGSLMRSYRATDCPSMSLSRSPGNYSGKGDESAYVMTLEIIPTSFFEAFHKEFSRLFIEVSRPQRVQKTQLGVQWFTSESNKLTLESCS